MSGAQGAPDMTQAALTPADKKRINDAYTAAQRLQAANRLDEAREAYAALLKRYPRVAEAHFQIARILLSNDRFTDARAAAEAALKLRPREESLWLLLADIARAEKKMAPAALLARAKNAGLPDDIVARIEKRFARAPAKGAVPPVPEEARAMLQRAGQASADGDDATALKFINRALKRAPGHPAVLIRRAETLLTMGDLPAALADAKACVRAAPDAGRFWSVWARIEKIKEGDPMLAELERRHEAAPEGSDDRRQMAYALAKAMEDIRADDRLFGYLKEANALTAKRYPYGHKGDEAAAREARESYTPELVRRWEGKGAEEPTPIFVTGLPRSGTTLVEQIISSHPMVTAGGEMALVNGPIGELAKEIAEKGAGAGGGLARVGREYAKAVNRLFPGKTIVTDKSISSYVHAGHLRLALPKAKIVIVRRDPRDSVLALWKMRFSDGMHRYTYSMDSIAWFYKMFANQVAFWRKAAPEAFIEVRYEDVVADLETQARRLIAYCGLPWDDACLNFHENERRVKTLSSAQVRQPIYSSSVGAWKRYEKDLAPLLKALGPIEELL
jgi:tetratricopeptide (TPR) repeat protein